MKSFFISLMRQPNILKLVLKMVNNFEDLSKEVSKISLQLTTQDLPKQGIFFASPFAPPLLMHLLDKLLHFRDSALIHQIAVVGFAGGNFVVDGR